MVVFYKYFIYTLTLFFSADKMPSGKLFKQEIDLGHLTNISDYV